MRARSRARGWALQILYAWESRGDETTANAVLNDFEQERQIAEESREYIRSLVGLVANNRDNIDRELEHSLTNWRLDRLSVIDRNILRLAAAELLYEDDVPAPVAIQEAIMLAEKYGTNESPRFVNGVLDALRKSIELGKA
ncbi:MAG TPA: transcription antitermination factor NusB [Longimicrobiales bacterium]|nr:transcription antitermination factor NusB [Longimicrobiales bacterium]